jgi:hypothetical protein
MKTTNRNPENSTRPRTQWGHRASALLLLPLAILMTLAPGAQAARPGGVAVLLPPFVFAPPPSPVLPTVSPFDMIGFIQSATVTGGAGNLDYFAGGTMEVNGFLITVPRNTIFQMPATQMTWADMFMNAPAPYKTAGQSGLALSDTPKPLTTYEVHVQGNRVVNTSAGTDQYIAGLIYISQQSGTVGYGIINAIDYSKCAAGTPCMPDVWVGKTLQARTGARMRINTISGRYGAVDANIAAGIVDKRFTADEDNPTIVARTGYPVCLPRFDPAVGQDSLCPTWNRPKDPFTGAWSVNYTMAPATAGAPGANGITHQVGFPTPAVTPDPFEQVPLEVGDTISFVGNLAQDVTPCAAGLPASSCMYVSAHTLTAELGIYTAPGTWPVYTFMSEFRIGAAGQPNPLFPQEAVEKVFGDFFTTDNTQLVDVYAADLNSTSGVESHRYYGSSDPFGPPLGGLKGRARFRTTVGNFMPATRFMAVASRSWTQGAPVDAVLPTAQLTANGLKAGYFEAPQFQFIFPENLILGSPQVPIPFQEFPFLANGSGPYVPWNSPVGTAAVGNLGQITPFPSLNAPPVLPNSTGLSLIQPPTPNAGSPQTVPSGATVNLSAAGSMDPNVPALPLIYTWFQSGGLPVILLQTDPMLPTQQFKAPTLAAGATPVVLTFQLAVCNGFTCGGIVSVNVTVTAAAGAPSVTLSAAPGTSIAIGQLETVNCSETGGTAPFTFNLTQTAGPAQVLSGTAASASRSFTPAPLPAGTPLPVTLTFTCKVQDSAAPPNTTTTTLNVLLGPDTMTAANITYSLAKSRLQASVVDSVPGGVAVITATPLDSNGNAITAAMPLFFDPTQNLYIAPLNWLLNPIPNSVLFKSSLGGTLNAPVQKIR